MVATLFPLSNDTSHRWIRAFVGLVWVIGMAAPCWGQPASLPSRDAIDLIRAAASEDEAEATAAETEIRALLATNARTEELACAWALCGIARYDVELVRSAMVGIPKAFPQPTQPTRNFAMRLRVWRSLADPNATDAETAFRSLVDATLSGSLPSDELKLNARMIGFGVGMLNSKATESPIELSLLEKIDREMTLAKVRSVASEYAQSKAAAEERRKKIEAQIEEVQAIGLEKADEVIANYRAQFVEMGMVLSDAKAVAKEITRNARERTKQNKRDSNSLRQKVTQINASLLLPTDGHPGPPPIEPRKPELTEISIDEYKKVQDGYEDYTDSNGVKSRRPKYKRERKSSAEINAEKNQKYSELMYEYRIYKADFDRRNAIYQPLLAEWVKKDRDRRTRLVADRQELTEKINLLSEANKQIDKEKVDVNREAGGQKKSLEQLAEDFEILEIAIEAVRGQRISQAFRPQNFPEMVQIPAEKLRLLGLAKNRAGS